MKKKLKFLRRQYKKLPKPMRTVVAVNISLILLETIVFCMTLDAYILTIIVWILVATSYVFIYERQVRIKSVHHYRIGKLQGLMFAKQLLEKMECSSDDECIRVFLN